jgi:hypothetical protein
MREIILLVFIIANIACAFWNVENKNYKLAILNGFAAGFCCHGLVSTLI